MSYLDTRDLAERFDELQEEMSDLNDAVAEEADGALEERAEWLDDNQEELDALTVMESEVGDCFRYGETLIPEHLFTDYTQDIAEDMGAVGENSGWIVIDWEATADGLRMDYSEVDYQGETYLFRMS